MKTGTIYKISLIMLACMSVVACSEKDDFGYESAELVPLVINATPTTTRTTLAEDGTSIYWQADDEIAVYDYNAPKHKFAIESFDKSKARFLGKITAKKDYFLTLYPYDLGAENLTSENEISVELPIQQTAAANTFASGLNVSVGKGTRNVDGSPSVLTFYNVCQLLKFEVPEYVSGKITKIKFTTNTAIAGTLNIDYANDVPVTNIDSDGSKEITILPPTGSETFAAGTYYIVSAPVQMDGFTMSFVCDETSYTLSSNSTFGGSVGKIYSLGKIDLVNTPKTTVVHVYNQGVLKGTKLVLNNAPIEGREWSAVVKNSNDITVRTLQGVGSLSSTEEDDAWPYLPQGAYSVEYSFESSNGKPITKNISFNVVEKPTFSISTYAYTSFSYYKGDGVTKDIEIANGLDNMTIYEPSIIINGIDSKILNNSNYSFTSETNVTSGMVGRNENVIKYNSYKVSSLTSYTLTGKVTFDGVSVTSDKTVYITGLPYSVAPPTQTDWTGSAQSWTGSYVRLHKHTIEKTFYCPENINVKVGHSVRLYKSRVGTTPTYQLQCSGTTIATFSSSSGGKAVTDNGEYDGTLSTSSPKISCVNSGGSSDGSLIGEGSNTQVKSISIEYR